MGDIIKINGKTKNKMGGCRPNGNITDPRDNRMEVSNDREEWRCLLGETRAQEEL
jgi:hypothetical protein